MGSYSFRWDHPAEEVYVTGTFDNWTRRTKLVKRDFIHEKTVDLPQANHKILYKFVADGVWKHDPTARTEVDEEGNINNVLYPEDIVTTAAAHILSSVAPTATTTTMAGQVPLATPSTADVPGAFPQTPALDSHAAARASSENEGILAGVVAGASAAAASVSAALTGHSAAKDEQTYSVNPIPASEGHGNPIHLAPGDAVPDPSTFNKNTIASGVHDDESLKANAARAGEQTFGVAPIPASEGFGNPIRLAPGEKVPDSSTFNKNTIASGVHDDESLKANAAPAGEQTFGVAPIPASEGFGNPIRLAPGEKVPDSSTFNKNTIASGVHDDESLKANAAPGEQTFGVAPIPATAGFGNPVHLRPGEKVPDPSSLTGNTIGSTVKLDQASYEKSASGAPQLPPALSPTSEREAAGASIFGLGPQTSHIIPESSLGWGKDTPAALDTAPNVGPHVSSVAPGSTTAQLAGQQPLELRGVPGVVAESQREVGVGPEAAANPVAVQEKQQVESELKSKVSEAPPAGSTAGSTVAGTVAGAAAGVGAAATAAAISVREKTHEKTGVDPASYLPASAQNALNTSTSASAGTASAVPSEVLASQREAHASPEASANPLAVREKSALESELLSKIPASQAAGSPAPTASAATASTAPASVAQKAAAVAHARAAPNGEQSQPVVTTGIESAAVPRVSTPRKSLGDPTTPNKRNSFIGSFRKASTSAAAAPSSPASTAAATEAGSERRKKGFFSKLKEKLKN